MPGGRSLQWFHPGTHKLAILQLVGDAHYVYTSTCSCPPGFAKLSDAMSVPALGGPPTYQAIFLLGPFAGILITGVPVYRQNICNGISETPFSIRCIYTILKCISKGKFVFMLPFQCAHILTSNDQNTLAGEEASNPSPNRMVIFHDWSWYVMTYHDKQPDFVTKNHMINHDIEKS